MSTLVPKYDRILGTLREEDVSYGTLAHPFPSTGSYYTADNGTVYLVTIDHTIPDWVFTPVTSSTSGSPMGLLLALTYP